MKNKVLITLICLVVVCLGFVGVNMLIEKKDTTNDSVSLAEVTHSPFYAPLYVAIENGYMKEEKIDIDLVLTPGADKVAASVISGDTEIGFAGPESAIYVYKGNESDLLVTFAGLTNRDGQFIVSRSKNFNWTDLEGKEVLVGRKGGMPSLNFIRALKNANVDISKVNLNYSIDFASLSGSFIGGTGNYVNLFEPNASTIEKSNKGYVVASVGSMSGTMPYTAFYTKKSFYENHKDLLKRFNSSLNKGLDYVNNHSAKEIAEVIIKQFPNMSITDLETYVKRYKENDSWYQNTTIPEKDYNNLEDLMIENNLLDEYVPFQDLVKNFNE